MILSSLKETLSNGPTTVSQDYLRNTLKESIQNYILQFIYNSPKYKNVIFTGGTCLRKIYYLPRLSEDLDFDFTPDTFDVAEFATDIAKYFESQLQYKNITTKISGNSKTVFVKFPTILRELGLAQNIADSAMLLVRCYFSTCATEIFNKEVSILSTKSFTIAINNYTLDTLFANKIHAFINREYYKGDTQKVAFKGRDVFDIMWFLQQSKKQEFKLKPNWQRLKFYWPNLTPAQIVEQIENKIKTIQSEDLYKDVAPFVATQQEAEQISQYAPTIILQDIRKII